MYGHRNVPDMWLHLKTVYSRRFSIKSWLKWNLP